MNKFFKKSAAVVAGLAAGAANAAIDVSAVTAATTDAGTAVATIGGAVLVVYVGIKAYKWIRGAL
jgi:hypothetical protein